MITKRDCLKAIDACETNDISVKDLLGEWATYVDWDRFHENGAVVTNISGEPLYKCMTVTIEFPMINFTKGDDKE